MPGKPQYTVKHMVRALTECRGLVSYAARRLGCSVRTVENYCTRYAAVRQARDDARGELLDLAETHLWQSVERGDLSAVMFVLRSLGRDRGYGDKTEITGPDGGPIQHAHIHIWQERLQAAHNAIEARRQAALPEGTNGAVEEV